jgi:hypothetical protein
LPAPDGKMAEFLTAKGTIDTIANWFWLLTETESFGRLGTMKVKR